MAIGGPLGTLRLLACRRASLAWRHFGAADAKMVLPRRPLTHFVVIAAGLLHERIGPGGSPWFDFALGGPRQRQGNVPD